MTNYLRDLCDSFGAGWNRFWFTPSDPATLGLIRLLTGLVSLYWLATYGYDLVRLFGPSGMLPVTTVLELAGSWASVSYLNYLQSPTELWIAHILALAVMALFTVGLFTRVTSVLTLIVLLSYIHRGPMISSQVEPILSLVVFYLCLGPAGAYLSIDSLLESRKRQAMGSTAGARKRISSTSATVALRLLQVHVSVIYLMMALAKLRGGESGPVWWMGEAVWWIIARPESRLVDFTWLHDYPLVVNAWTHAIVAFEFAFAILIWNRLSRPLLLAVAVPMWVLLALITGLTPFCLMMLIASAAFVPAAAIRGLSHRREAAAMSEPLSDKASHKTPVGAR